MNGKTLLGHAVSLGTVVLRNAELQLSHVASIGEVWWVELVT